ncbi:MAG: M14 family zinc carboxypeptidase [Clostridia bacterium]|nr:M14 family zinc carboxypeptidase [Clostridia bacterium]
MFSAYGCEVGVVGESTLHQRIPYVYIGNDKSNCIIVQGGIHAREHITSLLVVNMAKHLLKRNDLLLLGGIYFLPMVNVDGVRLAQEGLDFVKSSKRRQELIDLNGGSIDFSLWKANIRGVDLNVNFDASWGKGEQNVDYPATANYIGSKPESEKETRCLVNFTREVNPLATLSYHCKGEVIYWRFGQTMNKLWMHYRLAKAIAEDTGYALAHDKGSVGGYKDWCIHQLGIPAFTIEVGSDYYKHPYPYSDFFNIFRINKDVPRKLLNSVVKMKQTAVKHSIIKNGIPIDDEVDYQLITQDSVDDNQEQLDNITNCTDEQPDNHSS